jgi:hypothetical protein
MSTISPTLQAALVRSSVDVIVCEDELVVAEVGAESDITRLLEASRESVSRTSTETS